MSINYGIPKVVVKVENLDLSNLKPKISSLKLPYVPHGGQWPLFPIFGFDYQLGCRSLQEDMVFHLHVYKLKCD